MDYKTIAAQLRRETERVKGSRFIAHVAPCSSTSDAEGILERLRAEYSGASHHCWAYRLGNDGGTYRFSDDGEPGGSAGRPILRQIEGHGLTELIVVVVRYFGGTKLGVGGLVRAYSGATAEALNRVEIRTVVITQTITIDHPYDCSREVQRVLTATGLSPTSAEYGETVRLVLEVPRREADELIVRLTDATAGRALIEPAAG